MNRHEMARMDHEAARARFSALIDGALSPAEAEQVEAHLEGCAACRAHLAQLRATVTLLRGVEHVQVPEGFAAAVRGRIERLSSAAPGLGWSRLRAVIPNIRWSWKTAAAAASIALVAVFAANVALEVVPVSFRKDGARLGEREHARDEVEALEGKSLRTRTGLDSRAARAPAAVPAPQEAGRSESGAVAQSNVAQPGDSTLRRVVRTGQVAVEVDKFDDAARRLLTIAEGAGGFIADSSYAEEGGTPSGTFTLRVPSARFSEAVRQVEALGTVRRRQISGQDVTEEFVDTEARVRNLERHETRLLAFMDRATKIPDLMAIEQEVARVRGEIERLTGRLRFLSNRVDLATIQAEVSQKRKKSSGFWDFDQTLSRIQTAFLNTVRQVLGAVEGVVAFAAALLPVVLLGLVGWGLLRRATRRADRPA